jgi:hypothetical protein
MHATANRTPHVRATKPTAIAAPIHVTTLAVA